ncbi:alpha/beta hydrolase [Psychromicrobium sp. YIM B11713]|uniref:alpha/beta hydrolase n=1 Tax=Psychromicrobium sp. YIM B11713 TaxID=3145233 RepID=UPI00374F98EE
MVDSMLGASPEELKGLAKYVDSTSQDLSRTTATLEAVLNGQIRWYGADASGCRRHWAGSMRPALNQAISMLSEVSKVLVRNAEEQIKASAVEGGGSSGRTPGSTAGSLPALPPEGSDPRSVNDWWQSLSPEEQARYIAEHPERIGNLDGIPASVRDQANRLRLETEEAALRRELASLGPDEGDRRDQINQALGTIDQIRKSVEKVESSGEQAQVLLFDDSLQPPRAAVGVGNADTADNVGVFTPGIGSEPDTSLSGYVNDMLALKRRTDRLNMSEGNDQSTALIAWIGYDAPSGPDQGVRVVEAASPINGIEGGRGLAHFAEGLDAANRDSNLTAIGHSYGSFVTGEAVQHTDVFDNMVVFGSPGLGTSDAGNLRVPEGHRFVLEAKGDAVADLAAFGDDPNQLSGIEDLSTSSSSHGSASSGHSQYLQTDSTSQYNIATVVAGRPDLAVHGENAGAGDALRGGIGLITGVDPIRGGVEGLIDGGQHGGDVGESIAGTPGRIVGTVTGGIIGGVDGAVDSAVDDVKGLVSGTVGAVKGLFD